MIFIINRIVCAFISVSCFFSGVFGTIDAERIEAEQYEMVGEGSCYAGNGRVSVHDPSVVQAQDGTFYIFGSHGCVAKSADLLNWENVACGVYDSNRTLVKEGSTLRQSLSEPLAWTDAFQTVRGYNQADRQTNIWAPDVIYNKAMGKYCYYGCSSVWGLPHSVIWLATSDSIEGPYEYKSSVVYSGFDSLTQKEDSYARTTPLHYSFTNIASLVKSGKLYIKDVLNNSWCTADGEYDSTNLPNAIDPTVFYDEDGSLWMVYGSYFGGVYIMPLDEKTGEPDYRYMKNTEGYDVYFGKRLSRTNAMNEGSGEAPYIVYDPVSDYYYLYITYGALNSLGGYNIREYRSKSVDGPYIDAAGNNALDYVNSGVKLFGNYKFDCLDTAYLAGGHSSSFITEDGRMLQIYHTRFNYGNEGHQVRVHQMARTENGWVVMLPFEYSGETVENKAYTAKEICGGYEFINHGAITNGCSTRAQVESIIAPTQSVILNADGTITGIKRYESTKENTAAAWENVSGTWEIKAETCYAVFNIGDVRYEGVFCKQRDESPEKTERLVFSAIGSNNECIWGVKK